MCIRDRLNTVLRAVTFGLVQGPEWLSDPHYALWIICFLRIWQFGSAMVLFLAALKGVPADLYDCLLYTSKGIAGHRPGLLFRGLCRRGLLRLCKEVLSRRFHGIRHDGPDGGLGCRAQRVHAKGAARPRDEGFDGLTAALLHLGAVRAKVHIKGSARCLLYTSISSRL